MAVIHCVAVLIMRVIYIRNPRRVRVTLNEVGYVVKSFEAHFFLFGKTSLKLNRIIFSITFVLGDDAYSE